MTGERKSNSLQSFFRPLSRGGFFDQLRRIYTAPHISNDSPE